jgi:DNA polymerase-3 subunit epsilon
VREGEVVAAGACYVDPLAPFDPRHTRIHGIDASQVRGKGSFAEHWAKVAEQLAGRWVLAHNATFTARCLHALSHTLAPLGAPPRLLCTLRTARRVWPRASGYSLDHLAEVMELTPPTHDPHAGATACAELAQRMCETRGLASPAAVAAELGVGATPLSWSSSMPL